MPKTIWLTSFDGATTNDYCRTSTFGKGDGTIGENPAVKLEGKRATEGIGGEKVDAKEGTTKFGNWLTDPVLVAEIGGKPTPKAARSL